MDNIGIQENDSITESISNGEKGDIKKSQIKLNIIELISIFNKMYDNYNKKYNNNYEGEKFCFNEILLPEIGDLILENVNIFFDRKPGELSPILGKCIEISEDIVKRLKKSKNKNIVSIKLKQGIVLDKNKIDDGYNVKEYEYDSKTEGNISVENTYSQHTIVSLDYIYNGKIENIDIDLTKNQFEVKEKSSEEYRKNIIQNIESNEDILGEIISIGLVNNGEISFFLVPEKDYLIDELFDRGYEPEVQFHNGQFIRDLKEKYNIPKETKILTEDEIKNGYDYNIKSKIDVGEEFYILEYNGENILLKCFIIENSNEDNEDDEGSDDIPYSEIERDIEGYIELVEKNIKVI